MYELHWIGSKWAQWQSRKDMLMKFLFSVEAEECTRIWGSHSGDYQQFCFLAYNAVYYVESQQTFRRNMTPPPSRSKNKPRNKNKREAGIKQSSWSRHVPPEHWFTSDGLHGVVDQKITLFTVGFFFSNPAQYKVRSKSLWRWYISKNVTFLDIIHRLACI
jgi:hypothetical protein